MSQRIFVDANVINDIFDAKRRFHEASYQCLEYCLEQGLTLVTTCDIVTTVYYITAKSQDRAKALDALEQVNAIFEIVPFGNNQLADAITLMQQDTDYTDLEDTVQYVLATQAGCDIILSNDAGFVAKNLTLMSSTDFAASSQSNR
ncbi:type II toxin-antitoxin system VapC family toxin [Thiothrix fructosivorans]|uniref:Type II toxin-antitoxin system VapC family toxin n=1 Tax=Thiothrix fructosivorans TaxID=111770 RepID=A0A8B0SRV6_9GAMM|nr:PIN domain-containing protein [Thiothrix fructosivorans]MBO0612926.1 type II toxin-antitoxin system VapC family toxin [Thiothrix fructosivorans]QTX11622.1 type II toxin-antitoxin system VapC family toxin [Thiothrix fructosivorans]